MKIRHYQPHHSLFRLFWMAMALLALFTRVSSAQTPRPGDLLVVSSGTNSVHQFDGASGAYQGEFIPSESGGLNVPESMIYGPDNNLYVSSWGTGSVLRYDGQTGSFIDAFVPSGSGGLSNPDQLAFGPDGNLYVSDQFSAQILRYDGKTGAPLGTFVSDGALSGFIGFTFGPDGNLYASMFNGFQSILRYNGKTGEFMDVFVSGDEFDVAFAGLAFGPDGNLYACRYHLGQVWCYDGHDGHMIRTMQCPGDIRADYLAFGPDGRLYVGNLEHNVKRFDWQTGECLGTFASDAALQGTTGLAFVPGITLDPALVPQRAALLGPSTLTVGATAQFTLRVTFTNGAHFDFPQISGAAFSAVKGSISASGLYTAPAKTGKDGLLGTFTQKGIQVTAHRIIKVLP